MKVGRTTISWRITTDNEIEIGSVRTPQTARNTGSATAAMTEFCQMADKMGLPIILGASPLDKRTKLGRLVAFYRKFGFEPTGKSINIVGDPYMRREPKSIITAAVRVRHYLTARRMNSERLLSFHGTTTAFVRSIKKHGLDPDMAKQGNWTEEEFLNNQPSRKSFPGVYFTRSASKAVSYSFDIVNKHGGNKMVVVALIQPRSATPDEDDYSWARDLVMQDAQQELGDNDRMVSYYYTLYETDHSDLNKSLEYYFNYAMDYSDLTKHLVKHKNKEGLKRLLKDVITAELRRRMAMFIELKGKGSWYDPVRYVRDYVERLYGKWDDRFNYLLEFPSRAQAESDKRHALDKFIRATKFMLRTHDDSKFKKERGTFRLTERLGFSGRNRIIALVEVNNEDNGKVVFRSHYGGVPEEFLLNYAKQYYGEQRYEQAMKDNFTVEA